MPRAFAALALALALPLVAAASTPEDAQREAFTLRRQAEAGIRRALEADDPGAILAEARETLGRAQTLLEDALGALPPGAAERGALETDLEGLNALVFWCERMRPVDLPDDGEDEEPASPPPAPRPTQDDEARARTLYERALAFERAHPDELLLCVGRYFEVAERYLGTAPSLEAQRRALTLQQELLRRPAAGSVEAGAPRDREGQGSEGAEAEAVRRPAAERLAARLGCAVKDLGQGRFELLFDFEAEVPAGAWEFPEGEWIVSGGKLSGRDTRKKAVAEAWLACPMVGDVEAEMVATPVGGLDGITLTLHAEGNDTGYGVAIMDNKNKHFSGFRTLSFKKRLTFEPGDYRLAFALDGKKLSFKVNGKTLYKDKDPAPLPGGRLRITAHKRAVFDDLKIVCTPDPAWLEGLP